MKSLSKLPPFKKMDQGQLTRCVHERSTCPHPAICKRRAKEDEKGYDLHDPEDDCLWYVEHETLRDEGKIFRGRGRRHNAHAPPSGTLGPRALPTRLSEPSLMVKRHIRNGEDIND